MVIPHLAETIPLAALDSTHDVDALRIAFPFTLLLIFHLGADGF